MRNVLFSLCLLAVLPASAQQEIDSRDNPYASAVICNTPDGFPARKTALLNALPKNTLTKQEVMTLLTTLHNALKLKYPKEPVAHAMEIIAQMKGDIQKIAFIGVGAWYNGAPAESILLLTYAGSKDPTNVTLNNCGAVLNLICMQEKALPVLKHVLPKDPKNCTLLNNIGQSFAGLGEKDSAMYYFNRALETCPYHPEANATAAYIAYARGQRDLAADYMEKSLTGAYSEERLEFYNKVARNPKDLVKEDKINPENEEYFKPNGFGPPPNCRSWDESERITKAQDAVHKKAQEIIVQCSQTILANSLPKILEDPVENANWQSGKGWTQGPLARKVMHIIEKMGMDTTVPTVFEQMALVVEKAQQRRMATDAQFEPQYKACIGVGGNCSEQVAYRHCKQLEADDNITFREMSVVAEQWKNWSYPKEVKTYNNTIYLRPFVTPNARARKGECAAFTLGFVGKVSAYGLSTCPPSSKPNCVPPPPPESEPQMDPLFLDGKCPIDINIPFVVGRISLNCDEFGFEIGEGVTFRYGKNFKTHETTLAVGVGTGLDIPGLDIGVGAEVAFKFDGNNQLIDVIGGAEAGLGVMGINIASAGATVGINSSFTPYMNVIGN